MTKNTASGCKWQRNLNPQHRHDMASILPLGYFQWPVLVDKLYFPISLAILGGRNSIRPDLLKLLCSEISSYFVLI